MVYGYGFEAEAATATALHYYEVNYELYNTKRGHSSTMKCILKIKSIMR